MCGILFAQMKKQNQNQLELLKTCFSKIKHRGPDASNYLICESNCNNGNNNKYFMGGHRLKIINPSDEGNQPLELDDNLVLICNGLIYNYLELARKHKIPRSLLRTDIDIILHLYKKGLTPRDICNELDGVFAFVLLDKMQNRIIMGRDPHGIRPLFYQMGSVEESIQMVASEIKAFPKPLDKTIQIFPPNRFYDSEYPSFQSYNNVFRETMTETSYPIVSEKIYDLLIKAVKKRIDNSDRPVAFLCSGGVDSSIIFGIARNYLKMHHPERELHVYCMNYAKSNSTSYDLFYAEMLMTQYRDDKQVQFHSVSFTWDEVLMILDKMPYLMETYDPNTIRASIPMILLAKYLSEQTEFKVFLSGEGADELFMGYNYFQQVPNGNLANAESRRLMRNLHMFDVLRADRCFAAHGLEIRIPFLDRDLVHYASNVQGKLKMFRNGIEKKLLRDAVREKIPELTMSRVIDRQKERFSDGCGFSYVPDILNYVFSCSSELSSELSSSKSSSKINKQKLVTLEEKEKSERAFHKQRFRKAFGEMDHLIIKRELPDWCDTSAKNQKLIG